MLQQFDERNSNIIVHVGGKLLPRNEAKVSVFDSIVQGGDGVWEGLRIYNNKVFCLDRHIQRMHDSAHTLAFENVPSVAQIKQAIFDTLHANGMYDNTHIRLTLTRGEKITSGMDPRLNTKGCTLIVLAEWKPPVYENNKGIEVITASTRRNGPQFLDSKIHHNNLLNNILAKIEANIAGADAAIMLDAHGFVSELNDTNIFIIKNNKLITPHPDSCLPGITRNLVLQIAQQTQLEVIEKNISLTEMYTANEAFATGTMGELTPIVKADGRIIGQPLNTWTWLPKLTQLFKQQIEVLGENIPSQ